MNPNYIVLTFTVLIGLVTAIEADIRAWRASGGDFDWATAVVSWLKGALIGIAGGLGISATNA